MFSFCKLSASFNTTPTSFSWGTLRCLCSKAAKNKHMKKPTIERLRDTSYGQPTVRTHPHLLKQDEIMPLIQKSEFQERRQKLMDFIMDYSRKNQSDINKHIVVIPSATKQYMSDKIPYVFRQNSDFLYLSGCLEPDTCLLLTVKGEPGAAQHCSTLFVRNRDSHSELWDGPRTSTESATALFGVDQALPMMDLPQYLHSYVKSNKMFSLWYDFMNPVQPDVNKIMKEFISEAFNRMWESPQQLVHKLRLFKSPAEVALMQKSCDIASEAISKTIAFSKPGISEHQIFAKVDYECRMAGAEYLAYPPVVAGGKRANVIHYISNNQIVRDGEMVLMDAGCECHGYSSDITRTWPVNGKFTDSQRILYEIVLEVQQELIKLCYGMPTLDSLFDSMCLLLGRRLQEIGLIPKNCSLDMMTKLAYQFCPHHVSHYLGMDVHDTSTIKRNINIAPGMVVTIEPGIYINEHHKAPLEFTGLGVRIEDDILITDSGPIVLTKNCPKDIYEIEKLAQNSSV